MAVYTNEVLTSHKFMRKNAFYGLLQRARGLFRLEQAPLLSAFCQVSYRRKAKWLLFTKITVCRIAFTEGFGGEAHISSENIGKVAL